MFPEASPKLRLRDGERLDRHAGSRSRGGGVHDVQPRWRWFFLVAFSLALACGLARPTSARAQEAAPSAEQLAEARGLFERGLTAADAERWAEAVELFRRAREIVERPSIVFNLGQALVRLGRSSEARAALDRFVAIADARVDQADIAAAQRLLAELGAAQGTLELSVEPADAVIELDGAPLEGSGAERAITLDPGRHRIAVTAPGYRPDRFEVSVIAGSRERRSALLERLPSRPATLVVHAPVGAEVRVDGLLAGRGEIETELVPGDHHVVVSDAGASLLERDLSIGEGDRLVLDAIVHETGVSIAEEPWLWIVVGLAVVGAGVGIGVGVVLSQPPTDPALGYAGSTGVTVSALRF
jgi:hypothetical protein